MQLFSLSHIILGTTTAFMSPVACCNDTPHSRPASLDVQAEESYLRAGTRAKILPHPATSESLNDDNPILKGLSCLVCCFRLSFMRSIIVRYNFCCRIVCRDAVFA
ncbi:hypothetical protein C7974DRAFT_41162 [Boeremia exigua]|uniref:uncharacterized protein n=1 Tax=Boeremia exigua TaxID=749465 RepID=UPI001E8D4BAE|nr:uncharacterized protein C7974DRAFT_41162 [Boeremia exigua]KAH6619064.1 hypothetical protein C7974DRAFT_41162 [Boeremia exigua]